jgi:hypothetical protein
VAQGEDEEVMKRVSKKTINKEELRRTVTEMVEWITKQDERGFIYDEVILFRYNDSGKFGWQPMYCYKTLWKDTKKILRVHKLNDIYPDFKSQPEESINRLVEHIESVIGD